MEKSKIVSGCKVLIIGGSAGSLDVLLKLFSKFKTIPSFAVVMVLHRKTAEDTTLEELIAYKSVIPVMEVEDKTPLLPGYIYIAPSDYHLLFEKNGLLSLDTSEKVNYSRPSIDVSFESAAEVYSSSLIGVLLSGANADGTDGLIAIKREGGITVVQDPLSAEVPFMPNNAKLLSSPDYILDTNELIEFICMINS